MASVAHASTDDRYWLVPPSCPKDTPASRTGVVPANCQKGRPDHLHRKRSGIILENWPTLAVACAACSTSDFGLKRSKQGRGLFEPRFLRWRRADSGGEHQRPYSSNSGVLIHHKRDALASAVESERAPMPNHLFDREDQNGDIPRAA
jgi:hypothetical protein